MPANFDAFEALLSENDHDLYHGSRDAVSTPTRYPEIVARIGRIIGSGEAAPACLNELYMILREGPAESQAAE